MKMTSKSFAFVAALCLVLTGCLKDKGFENHEYGINDPDTQPPGVGFINGASARNDFGLDVNPGSQDVTGTLYIKLLAAKPASSDITMTLSAANTQAVVTAYNVANELDGITQDSIKVLQPQHFNLPATVVLPAGATGVDLPLPIINTTALDASQLYGIAVTITSADGGYVVAGNQKTIFIVFSIKNQYDGKYSKKGVFYHPSYPYYPIKQNMEMHTTGPNSVKYWWILGGGYGNPFSTNAAGTSPAWFADQEPELIVDPTTNKITAVMNTAPNGTIVYGLGKGFDNAGYDSRWDPATKTFYVCYGYNLGAGGTFVAGTTRMWIDTLTRTGPR